MVGQHTLVPKFQNPESFNQSTSPCTIQFVINSFFKKKKHQLLLDPFDTSAVVEAYPCTFSEVAITRPARREFWASVNIPAALAT